MCDRFTFTSKNIKCDYILPHQQQMQQTKNYLTFLTSHQYPTETRCQNSNGKVDLSQYADKSPTMLLSPYHMYKLPISIKKKCERALI